MSFSLKENLEFKTWEEPGWRDIQVWVEVCKGLLYKTYFIHVETSAIIYNIRYLNSDKVNFNIGDDTNDMTSVFYSLPLGTLSAVSGTKATFKKKKKILGFIKWL